MAEHFPQAQLHSLMQKHRRRNVPPLPASMLELKNSIQDFYAVNEVYRDFAQGQDGSVALIFITDTMKEALKECTVLLADGTFKVSICHLRIIFN